MNELLVWTCGVLLLVLGLIACFIPVIPGPVIAYGALWVAWAFGYSPGSTTLALGAAVLLVVEVIDYVLPTLFARTFKCSGWGVFGCVVGTIVGLFFLPIGLLVGPIVGTVLGELIAGKSLGAALKGGFGAFCGFVSCLIFKIAAVGLFAWWFVARLMA